MKTTLLVMGVVALCIAHETSAIEPEPDWAKRYWDVKQREMATFRPPKVGDQITLGRRVGASLAGVITAIGADTITLDGKQFQAVQLTPDTCEKVFPGVAATRIATESTQAERADYNARKLSELRKERSQAEAARLKQEEEKQVELAKRQESEAQIKEEDFVGEPRQTFYVVDVMVVNELHQYLGKTKKGMHVAQDDKSAVYKIVLEKGGGLDMAEVRYESSYSGGTRTTSMAAMWNVMQNSVNAPKRKTKVRDIFLVGLTDKLADGDEWKGKIYKCGLFELYTGSPPLHMYATTKELAIEILQAQQK